jgi:hypothetical protein
MDSIYLAALEQTYFRHPFYTSARMLSCFISICRLTCRSGTEAPAPRYNLCSPRSLGPDHYRTERKGVLTGVGWDLSEQQLQFR